MITIDGDTIRKSMELKRTLVIYTGDNESLFPKYFVAENDNSWDRFDNVLINSEHNIALEIELCNRLYDEKNGKDKIKWEKEFPVAAQPFLKVINIAFLS